MGQNNTTKEKEMIIKNLRTILLGAFAMLLIYLYFFHLQTNKQHISKEKIKTINSKKEEKELLKYLNQLRMGAGLIPFSINKILNIATSNHASYLIQNNMYGHYEEYNRSGFTGKFAGQRVKYAGYNTELIIENVSSNNRNYKESIDGLFSAIYHRLAFLDFQADEIGISIKQNMSNKIKTAFVYNIGSSELNKLYKNSKKISKEDLNKALNINKNLNNRVVTYPFNKQNDIPPAFFNELPDPLPESDVSGFPISVSFNQALCKKVELLEFKLFDSRETEIKNTLVYDYKTDPNRRLNRLSFVLFPLDRLDWNSNYVVKFSAIVDSKKIEKKWSFKTRKYNVPLHKIEDENKTITVRVNQPNIFYFPPKTAKDLLHNIRYNQNFNMKFIDKNTLRIIALKESSLITYLKIGKHKLKLNIKK